MKEKYGFDEKNLSKNNCILEQVNYLKYIIVGLFNEIRKKIEKQIKK